MNDALNGFIPYKKGIIGSRITNELTDKPGCYGIIIDNSEKIYVGSSSNLAGRIVTNFSDLKYNRHKNKNLQEAYNKNPNAHAVAKPTQTVEEARQLEQKTVDELHPFNKLHNIATIDVTRTATGLIPSKEHRQKISTAHKERYATEEGKIELAKRIDKIKKPVNCVGIIYPSVTEAAKALGVTKATITNRCKNDKYPNFFKQ